VRGPAGGGRPGGGARARLPPAPARLSARARRSARARGEGSAFHASAQARMCPVQAGMHARQRTMFCKAVYINTVPWASLEPNYVRLSFQASGKRTGCFEGLPFLNRATACANLKRAALVTK